MRSIVPAPHIPRAGRHSSFLQDVEHMTADFNVARVIPGSGFRVRRIARVVANRFVNYILAIIYAFSPTSIELILKVNT
jgi:hypothetical protein